MRSNISIDRQFLSIRSIRKENIYESKQQVLKSYKIGPVKNTAEKERRKYGLNIR
jgi:hypothetical protein